MLFFFPGLFMYLVWLVGMVILGNKFFHSENFKSMKDGITEYIDDCNELNRHIEELKASYLDIKKTDYGEMQFTNTSVYNYKKSKLASIKYAPNIHECSRTVCDSARQQPFKYVCKYFNIKANEETLEQFEDVLNNFSAADEGKILLKNKRNAILEQIKDSIPWYVKYYYAKRIETELGFDEVEFNEMYYPEFVFRYTSAGGNSGTEFSIVYDVPMLERFIGYLAETVKFRKSAAGQRALMTSKLRKEILNRDNHTCKKCGNSTSVEPNLLLEVDHIVPISKGGLTERENLQTLCWKCNRRKGNKIED